MLTESEPERDVFAEERLPVQVRVIDKLADILFASDMILDMLNDERYFMVAGNLTMSVEPSVRRVYDQVNELMKQLTD
jgi:hypothetical protein